MTNLRMSMFTDVKSPWVRHPMLKAKVAECKHLLPIVAQISAELGTGSEGDTHRTAFLQALSGFVDMLDTCPMFPSAADAIAAQGRMATALRHADWLKQHALSLDT